MATPLDRRAVLAAGLTAGLAGGLAWGAAGADSSLAQAQATPRQLGSARPLALVYRGAASIGDCPEVAAHLLTTAPRPFRVAFCGPGQPVAITPANLSKAALYVQPGGGDDLDLAWAALRPFARTITNYVRGGGHYLGLCMGGYLAGKGPGFNMLPGDSREYITTPRATVRTDADALVDVIWRGRRRALYFQAGPAFTLRPGARATVLGRYTNSAIAAMVTPYGKGRVGVSGPHPEAPASWFEDAELDMPARLPFDLGHDLVAVTTGIR